MRRHGLRVASAVLLTAGVLLATPIARAQTCGAGDLRFMLPADGATGVPVDATFRAYYGIGARYASEMVTIVRGTRRESLVGAFDRTTGVLEVTSAMPLDPRGSYAVQWPTLGGGPASGASGLANITAGDGPDTSAPSVAEISRLDWDVTTVDDACIDESVERYLFDVTLAGASDDSDVSLLELTVYQTRGPLLSESSPPRAVATEPLGDGLRATRFTLPRDDGLGEVCFAVVVRDLRGRASAATAERCTVTEPPPFFRSCSVAAAGAASTRSPLAAFALALALLYVIRSARAPRCRRRCPRA